MLGLGSPAQQFALIVDTGSTVTYVPCKSCTHCGKQHQVQTSSPHPCSPEGGMMRCPRRPLLPQREGAHFAEG